MQYFQLFYYASPQNYQHQAIQPINHTPLQFNMGQIESERDWKLAPCRWFDGWDGRFIIGEVSACQITFQYKQLLMSEEIQTHILARFDIHKKIGSGAYGHVWKVTDKKTRKIKALKKNFDAFNNSTDAQRTYRQIMFLMQLSHPNIIKLEQVIRAQNNRDIYLVFQHMDIDLFTLIRQDILAQRHRKYIFYQMAKALFFLHSAGLIHRDIKPSNVLVNQSCEAKLCDFGLVRSLEDSPQDPQDILTEYIATRWYRAPQILLGSRKYTRAIDIWSMGCMLAEMQKGKPLFPGTSTINQLEKVLAWTGPPTQKQIENLKLSAGQQVFKLMGKIKKCNRRQLIPHANEECMDLISKMMDFDPDKRISVEQILQHPYFADFYNKKQLIASQSKIRIPVDDNQRLNLKEYRNIIYEQIRKKNKSSVDINNSTLYRIKQTVRKSQPKKLENQQKTIAPEQQQLQKKSFYKRDPVILGKGRNVKTIQKEWDPADTKKSILYKQSDKFLNTKYDYDWNRKKRSTTQANSNVKKLSRHVPTPVELRQKII